jgi:hypothetical protein
MPTFYACEPVEDRAQERVVRVNGVDILRGDELMLDEDRGGSRFPGQDVEREADDAGAVALGKKGDRPDQPGTGGT